MGLCAVRPLIVAYCVYITFAKVMQAASHYHYNIIRRQQKKKRVV